MAEGGYILILDEFQYFNRKGYEEFCSHLQASVDRLAAKADQVRGGPNGELSLTRARENFRRIGACDVRFVSSVRRPRTEEL